LNDEFNVKREGKIESKEKERELIVKKLNTERNHL